MSNDVSPQKSLQPHLPWLADAPMFIDADRVESFYDAVVHPQTTADYTEIEISDSKMESATGKVGASVQTSIGLLSALFPSLNIKAELGADVKKEGSSQNKTKVRLLNISTPQRQIVQLTLHYLMNQNHRIFFVDTGRSDNTWRHPETVSTTPREIVFLDLPSQGEASRYNLPETILIPTAAELENGEVITFFDKLVSDEKNQPTYPEKKSKDGGTLETLQKDRKEYWKWFQEKFNASQAMRIVEDAVSKHKHRLRWIDYRLPLTHDGDTLHLHLCPAGKYDTGVFAYNFIKRGYKHGLRLVGTLKSEPDMNVLAVYEK